MDWREELNAYADSLRAKGGASLDTPAVFGNLRDRRDTSPGGAMPSESTRTSVAIPPDPYAATLRDRKPEGFTESLQSVGGGVLSGMMGLDKGKVSSPLGRWATEYEGYPGNTVGQIQGVVADYLLGGGAIKALGKIPWIASMARKLPSVVRGGVQSGALGGLTATAREGARVLSGEKNDLSRIPKEAAEFAALDVAFRGLGGLARKAKQIGKKVLTKAPPSPLFNRVKGLVMARGSELQKSQYDTFAFRKGSEKAMTKQEKEDAIFFLQKTGNPYKGDVHAGDTYKRLSSGAVKETYRIKHRFERVRQEVNASGGSKEVPFLENYVTQMWRGSKKKRDRLTNYFLTKNPFAEGRSIPSYKKGIELGLKPRHDNVYDILESYEKMSHRIVQNNLLVKAVKGIKVEGEGPLITINPHKAPEDYVRIDSEALHKASRGLYVRQDLEGPVRDAMLKEMGAIQGAKVWVHPDLEKPLKAVFENPFSGRAVHAIETINAITKKLKLSASLFHHLALTESALYSGISPTKFRAGTKKLIGDKKFLHDALDAGLDITAPSDVQRGIVDNALKAVEQSARKIPGLKQGATGLRKANQKWDSALWDHYHRGLKAFAYYSKVGNSLNKAMKQTKRPLTEAQVAEVKQAVARHTNNAFGGQNWEMLLKSPRWRQVAHWAFLAPDWTLSNIKIATSAFKTRRGGLGSSIEGQLARRYWARAALVFFTTSNLANQALSGHWIWENEEGHKADIDTGKRDEKGRRVYVKMSKQVREPLRWITTPIHEAGVKAAPTLQMLSEQFTGKSLGGWPAGINTKDGFLRSTPDRAGALAKHLLPISLFSNNVGLSLPLSKGKRPKNRRGQLPTLPQPPKRLKLPRNK